MAADAVLLLNAGTTTTSLTLVLITWALLNNPEMMQRLRADLRTVMVGRDDNIDWATLEKLSYLVSRRLGTTLLYSNENKGAIIKEGLRFTYGNPGPVPRVVPSSGAVFCGKEIPAGVLIPTS